MQQLQQQSCAGEFCFQLELQSFYSFTVLANRGMVDIVGQRDWKSAYARICLSCEVIWKILFLPKPPRMCIRLGAYDTETSLAWCSIVPLATLSNNGGEMCVQRVREGCIQVFLSHSCLISNAKVYYSCSLPHLTCWCLLASISCGSCGSCSSQTFFSLCNYVLRWTTGVVHIADLGYPWPHTFISPEKSVCSSIGGAIARVSGLRLFVLLLTCRKSWKGFTAGADLCFGSSFRSKDGCEYLRTHRTFFLVHFSIILALQFILFLGPGLHSVQSLLLFLIL